MSVKASFPLLIALAVFPAFAADRLALPDAASQTKADKLIRDTFGDYTRASAAERPVIATRMLQQAVASTEEPATRYVLLKRAAELAAGDADVRTAMRAANLLADTFNTDADELRTDTLRKLAAASAANPNALKSTASAALDAADLAARAERFEAAARILAVAESAARQSRDSALAARVTARNRELSWMRQELTKAKSAEEKLAKNPADAEAATTLGRYLAIAKDDWPNALPLLAKSSSPALRAAAAADLADPSTLDKLLAAADAWWEASDKEPPLQQSALRRRAAYWYAKAATDPALAGLTRARVDKRLAEAAPPRSEPAPRPRNVLHFFTTDPEILWAEGIANGGAIRKLKRSEYAATLANPNCFNGADVVLWGVNSIRDLPITSFPEATQLAMKRFVEQGGDLIMFEQFTATNMKIIDNLFGLKTTGDSPTGADTAIPELYGKLLAAGYTKDSLKTLHFYNAYKNLPENTTILLKAIDRDLALAVVIPIANGRLILIGSTTDPNERPMDQVLLEHVFHVKMPEKK